MLNKKNIAQVQVALLALTLFVVPSVSYADWDHHDGDHRDRGHFYRYHDHPRFGLHVSFLPDGYYSCWVGGARYYYYDGLYYNYRGGDYIIVSPPAGAIVATIPSDFQPVTINGATYYVNNGTYYVYTHNGYQIVPQPTVTTAVPQRAFTLNIPNNRGGYTQVVIKRSGQGYIGPQGEFYPEFPKVVQLKAMYGR